MAATRPTYCGVLLVAALWLTWAGVCPLAAGAAPKDRRAPPPPPFASLFPLEEGWRVSLPGPPVAAPTHDSGHIFVPLSAELVALDWEHGGDVWSAPIAATSPPVAGHGLVYVAADRTIHALDAATGAARWTAQTRAPVRRLLVAGERLVGVAPGVAEAFEAATGQPLWTHTATTTGVPTGLALSREGLVIAADDGRVSCLAMSDGHELWARTLPGVLTPPLAASRSVYVGSTDNRFYALDARKGKRRWNWLTGGDLIGAASDAKAVYYTSLDAVLRAINPGNGHQRWKQDVGTRPVVPPLALDGAILVGGLSPALSGFAPLTGKPLGTFDLPGDLAGAPLVRESLLPGAVALAVVLKDGRALGLRALALLFNENPPEPLLALPGVPLPGEPPPEVPSPASDGLSDSRPDAGPAPGPGVPRPR